MAARQTARFTYMTRHEGLKYSLHASSNEFHGRSACGSRRNVRVAGPCLRFTRRALSDDDHDGNDPGNSEDASSNGCKCPIEATLCTSTPLCCLPANLRLTPTWGRSARRNTRRARHGPADRRRIARTGSTRNSFPWAWGTLRRRLGGGSPSNRALAAGGSALKR